MPKGDHLRTHGRSKTPEHNAWCLMKARCHNKNHPRYSEWGGRGIKVCDEWLHNFPQFLKDVGFRPSKDHSIDRIDNNGDYCPGNVRWATRKQQSSNRPSFCHQITINGKTHTASEWGRITGRDRHTIAQRYRAGIRGNALIQESGTNGS